MESTDLRKDSEINRNNDGRLYFFDNLRAFVIVVVIIFHAAIGYMSPPLEWWYVVDIQKHPIFNVFVMNTDVFIMPILFFIAGYFALPALEKKGALLFWQEKNLKIIIPWIAGVLFLAPAITYMIWYSRTNTPPEYFMYLKTIFFSPATFNHAHYWFLGDLLLFFLVLTALYNRKPLIFQRREEPIIPRLDFFPLFGLVTAVTFFIANLFFHADTWFSKLVVISFQPTRFLLYLGYFALGVYGWRNLWFTRSGYKPRLSCWLSAALLMLLIFTAYRILIVTTEPIALKAGHALVHSFFCLTAVFAMIGLFHKYCNSKAYLWCRLSANSYTIYYIHQFILLPIAYLVQNMEFNLWIKYLSVSSASVILCFLASEYIIRRAFGIGAVKKPRSYLSES